ncbi:hypothetical protein EV385_2983 [Krasilnikovia cinnamomea]|uniref:Uncharacterized protein n=1 Tax=Krasilnikovia cinnamomea TaxID=349313 RepID=A0A4Q7ZJU8_9ACTN|nr:hypothetical protein [Krasilnikovia cinnamomea]RZU51182.1 hypothetical protein EV385_2983 [Krasilnikovia cinnamomea]
MIVDILLSTLLIISMVITLAALSPPRGQGPARRRRTTYPNTCAPDNASTDSVRSDLHR